MNAPILIFNDVGGSEVVLIFLIVLIFFGPKSIPGIAKSLGKVLYSIRNASDDLKQEIKKSGLDVKQDINLEKILRQETEEISQPMDQVLSDIENTMHYQPNRVNEVIQAQTEVKEPKKLTPRKKPAARASKKNNLTKDTKTT